jgi:hypothetical protein
VLALALAGCYSPSPAVGIPCSPEGRCPGNQTCDMTQSPPVCVGALPADAAIDAPDAFAGCMDDNECTGATTPICDQGTHACRGCRADAECGSPCAEYTGECLPEGQAIYISSTGNDANNCNRAAPCRTFGKAQAQLTQNKRTIVVVDGNYASSGSPILSFGTAGGRVLISGEDDNPDGAFLSAMSNGTTNPQVVNVGGGTDLVLEGVTIRNGGNDGLRNFGALQLYRVAITGNNGQGLMSKPTNNAALRITGCTIADNVKEGLDGQDGPIDITRTLIARNMDGGVTIQKGKATITNTMIVHNGRAGSATGGLRLQQVQGLEPTLSFLTIAYNLAGGSNATGLFADQGAAISSSILVENNNNATGVDQICGLCTASFSLMTGTVAAGQGNIGGAPDFVDVATDDYHLKATSAAKDVADSAATTNADYDGDARPQGGGFDMGADELVVP